MIVSIHQPNYLPWLGFFDKIKRSDLFVIFDDVQFPRGKKHFGHRNQIKTPNGTKWLSVPIKNKDALSNYPLNGATVADSNKKPGQIWSDEDSALLNRMAPIAYTKEPPERKSSYKAEDVKKYPIILVLL